MYYVIDKTVSPEQVVKQETYRDLVAYLETMSVRAFKQSRRDRMIMLEEVGHGDDDSQSVNFVRSMASAFNIGIVRDNTLVRCDVPAAEFFKKEEFGN